MENLSEAYIGIGSNINPEKNIEKAFFLLNKKVKIINVSTFYLTKPVGDIQQNDYINSVWKIKTNIPPENLKASILQDIEKKLRRERSSDRYSSRTIDLDLLLYGDLIIKNEILRIPDPDIYKRDFIAIPLYELDPDLILPDTKEKIFDIAGKFDFKKLTPMLEFGDKIKKLL